jgi:hypothetical protein
MDLFVSNANKYYRMYHDNDGAIVEEEFFILSHTLLLPLLLPANSKFNKWYLETNKYDEYLYLKRFLLLSQYYHPPTTHFVLKTPLHGFHFEELIKTFDNSLIVITHREPRFVIPSIAKLGMFAISLSLRDVSNDPFLCKETFGKDMTEFWSFVSREIRRVRTKYGDELNKRVLDIEYSDIIKDPIGTVKRIYERAGLQVTEEYEKRLHEYIEENKRDRERGKGSAHAPYSLEEFGLDVAYVNKAFEEYRKERGYA